MLARDFVRFAEREYSVNWTGVQQRLAVEMPFLRSLGGTLCDPLDYPSYWCLPILIGSYLGASKPAVLVDTEAFLRACLVRHFAFECADRFEGSSARELYCLIRRAYRSSAVASIPPTASVEEKLVRKCSPWTLTMALGVRAIEAESGDIPAYLTAWRAIMRTFLCVQVIDDWNDRAEDAQRGQWNIWTHCGLQDIPSELRRLLEETSHSLSALTPHFLTRALDAQIDDTRIELGAILEQRRT